MTPRFRLAPPRAPRGAASGLVVSRSEHGGPEAGPLGARSPLPPAGLDMPTMSLPAVAAQDEGVVTVGVLIEVPDPWGPQLQECRARVGDAQAYAVPAHVTLLPPTEIPRDGLTAVRDHLRALATQMPPIRVELSGSDTFRPRSPVVFVRVTKGGEGCDDLQRRMRSGPLTRDLAFPFHPHVTVAHGVDDPSLDAAQRATARFRARFDVTEFWLYRNGSDGVWRPEQGYPLTGRPA